MNVAHLQQSVLSILQQRVAESASFTFHVAGPGVALVLEGTEDEALTKHLEAIVRGDGGREMLARAATIAIDAYLRDLVKDMDQGLTPLGFTISTKSGVQIVPSSGMADYWDVPYEYGGDERE